MALSRLALSQHGMLAGNPDAGGYGEALLRPILGWSPTAQALARTMQDAWIAMARTGNPAHEGLPEWPRYDVSRRATMRFEGSCAVEDAPFEDERRFWESQRG